MISVVAGILLPQSTLTSPWFLVFAAFVGVNTIIYIGLTLSRLIPWPRQVHPQRLRAILGVRPATQEETLKPLRPNVSRETPAESGVHDIARAFGWLGGVMMLGSTALAITGPRNPSDYAVIGVGLAFLAVAQVISVTRMSARTATWLWAIGVSGLAAGSAYLAIEADLELFGLVLILSVIFGAVSLTWPSFIFAEAVLLGSYVHLGSELTKSLDPAWMTPVLAAVIGAAVLMVIRRRSLKILKDVDRLENQLGSTDALTGVLTRQGLVTLGPSVRRAAQRTTQSMFVMIVDIDDLAGANRDFGMGYGDDLLRAVAQALRSTARDADLLGRWSGDEFALMGMGAEESIAALTERVTRAIAESTVSLGKPPLRVSIGTAVASADGFVETLVERALRDLESPTETKAPAGAPLAMA
jgi:diguanylate cyclase (GGDEF)-like protein